MKDKFTISVSVLYSFLQTVKSYNIDENRLLKECGMSLTILSSPDNRFSLDQYDRLVKKAVELSGDTFFGLRLGREFDIGTGNIVTYMIRNCSNLRDATKKYIEYQKIVGETYDLSLSTQEENAIISIKAPKEDIIDNRHIFEAILTAIYKTGNEMIAPELKLKEAHFKSPKPPLTDEYNKIFNCTLKWKMPEYSIIFDKKFLDVPLKQPNKELLTMLENQARTALRKLKGKETFTEKVTKILSELNFSENLKIEYVAQKIPVSVRTLQLKLKEENTSFQQIVDEIRRQIAISHLKSNTASIKEISYLLGFSEPAAFQKAFKKWSGQAPGRFRKANAVLR
ncbi:MAG: AraC family transcriptional regulator [Spirochaetia bacterium]|nr:AraC family transcriptional regulator [Spirochaetia bacterium]